jgi:tetratricopeptide (TPR) repeat protein
MPNSTDGQKEAQLEIYQKALAFADSAVALAPDESTPYLRRAIANGRIALFKGVFSVGGVVSQVKDDCYKAMALGKGGKEIQAITHYVLARTHGKVSEKWSVLRAPLGLGWAVLDSAYIYYDKALELDSSFLMIYLDYAKRLVSEDEYEKAKEIIEASKNAVMKDEDDEKRLEEIKELKKKVEEELD